MVPLTRQNQHRYSGKLVRIVSKGKTMVGIFYAASNSCPPIIRFNDDTTWVLTGAFLAFNKVTIELLEGE